GSAVAARLCLINAIVVLVVLVIVLLVPVSLQLNLRNFFKLTIIYVVSAVPFFFTGLLFACVFARERHRVSQLYGADLMGGALACLGIVPLLNLVGGPSAILFAAAMMAVAAAIWADVKQQKTRAFIAAAVLAALFIANFRGHLIDVVYAKGIRRHGSWVEYARWNAISRVEVDRSGDIQWIVIDADASTPIMSVDPQTW